jgi:mannose-6-phosphate isomerase-like protein (cupin superfamily)
MCGHWGDEVGGSGLFSVHTSDNPQDRGDAVTYPKQTDFDRHYHDCDEYWILLQGRGTAVSEGKYYAVGPGDCVATGRGHHHDFPVVEEPVHAVFLENTLEGRKRQGHLWNHTHGPAQPHPERL